MNRSNNCACDINLTVDDDFNVDLHVTEGGTTNYNLLTNKPSINGVELIGNKTLEDLRIDIPTKTSDLINDGADGTSTYVEADEIANGKLVLRLLANNTCELDEYHSPYKTPCTATYFYDLYNNRKNLYIVGMPTDADHKGNHYTIVELKTTSHMTIPRTHDYLLILTTVTEVNNEQVMRIATLTADDTDPFTGTYVEYPLTIDGDFARVAFTGSYNDLMNKPEISGITLLGNKTKSDLSIETRGKITIGGTEYAVTRKALAITENGVTTTYYVADIT